jgi:branched-chain amino acid transport system permease protein
MVVKLIELLASGLALGSIYALLAMAITIIWATTDVLDITIGAQATLAGIVATGFVAPLGIMVALGVGIGTGALVGILFLLFYKRHPGTDVTPIVLATFGMLIVCESLLLTFVGSGGRHMNGVSGIVFLGEAVVMLQGVVNMAVAGVLFMAVVVLLRWSPLGLTMRACAVSEKAAQLVGIPVRQTQFLTFVLGGILAVAGGVLATMSSGLSYSSPFGLTLVALSGALIFARRSAGAAFAGGLTIGVAETFGAGYLPSGWAAGTSSLIILIVLATSRLPANAFGGARP